MWTCDELPAMSDAQGLILLKLNRCKGVRELCEWHCELVSKWLQVLSGHLGTLLSTETG